MTDEQTSALSPEAQAAQRVLRETLRLMDFPATVDVEETPEQILLTLVSEQPMGVLIGKSGQTLNALELVVRAIVEHQTRYVEKRIVLDAEGYRQRHAERLQETARAAAQRVLDTGEPFALEPMNARDRRTVHTEIAEIPGLATESAGEDPFRHIVIRLAGSPQE